MNRRIQRVLLAAGATCVALVAAPLEAHATSYAYTGTDFRGGGDYAGVIGSNEPDQITVSGADDGRILFTDPAGIRAEDSCEQISETEAACSTFAGFFVVDGRSGSDSLIEEPSTPLLRLYLDGGNDGDLIRTTGPLAYANGQADDDVLVGGRGRQVFYGGHGDDTLRTKGGHDYLNGGDGVDSLFAGAGRDLLHAEDPDRDAVVSCGPGPDLALVSRNEPLPPRSCERYGVVHNGDVVKRG